MDFGADGVLLLRIQSRTLKREILNQRTLTPTQLHPQILNSEQKLCVSTTKNVINPSNKGD